MKIKYKKVNPGNLMQQKVEFNLDLDATSLGSAYTISQSIITEGKYIVQSCCPADVGYVKLESEPYQGKTQFLLEWCVTQEQIPAQFISGIIEGIKSSAYAGLKGCQPIINLRIQVIDGFYHAVDSRTRSYQVAAGLAMRKAFEQAGLTPIKQKIVLK